MSERIAQEWNRHILRKRKYEMNVYTNVLHRGYFPSVSCLEIAESISAQT